MTSSRRSSWSRSSRKRLPGIFTILSNVTRFTTGHSRSRNGLSKVSVLPSRARARRHLADTQAWLELLHDAADCWRERQRLPDDLYVVMLPARSRCRKRARRANQVACTIPPRRICPALARKIFAFLFFRKYGLLS